MKSLVLDAEWAPKSEYQLSSKEQESRIARNASAVWHAPKMSIEDRERPEPGDNEVLVRVAYAGVCGSDIGLIETDDDGYVHYPAYAKLPNIIGHEFSGTVVETGADVEMFAPGDLVTADVTDFCGRCDMCRQGFMIHCENFEQIGFTIPGAHAEYLAISEKVCWDVSSLSNAYDSKTDVLKAAATIEPTTISYYGAFGRADGVKPGDYWVVHGIGPIGLTGMNLARAAGAGKVIAFEPQDARRSIARDLGFEHVYDPLASDPAETVREITNGAGGDIHLETSGAVEATYPAIERSLAETASIVHISNAMDPSPVDTRHYQSSLAQIYATEGSGYQAFPWVIRMMAAGHLDNLPIITSEYSLSNAPDAVEQAAKRVDGKVLIEVAPE